MANVTEHAVQQNGVSLDSIKDDIVKLGQDQSAFGIVSAWFVRTWQPFYNASNENAFAVALESEANKLLDTSVGSQERRRAHEEQKSETAASRVLSSLHPRLRGIVEQILSLLQETKELQGSDAMQKIALQLDRIMFDTCKENESAPSLLRLLQIAHSDSAGEESGEVMKLKQRVWSLEERVDDLQRELRNARMESEERFKEMNSTFDFWAKLVLGELRNQNAAQTSNLDELNGRTSRLEECCLGINEEQPGAEEQIVDDITGVKQNRVEDIKGDFGLDRYSNLEVKTDQERERADFWSDQQTISRDSSLAKAISNIGNERSDPEKRPGSSREGSEAHLSARNSEMSVEGEDKELMQAFKKALGSHFTANPNPRCKARIFKDGHWTTLKRLDQGISH